MEVKTYKFLAEKEKKKKNRIVYDIYDEKKNWTSGARFGLGTLWDTWDKKHNAAYLQE